MNDAPACQSRADIPRESARGWHARSTIRPARRGCALDGETSGHIVLCGLDRLGFRTLEELRRLDETVVVVARASTDTFEGAARGLGATLIRGSCRDEHTLRAAGVPRARAIVIAEDDDVGNLHAALAAQDLNPRLRIVLRVFNEEFGRRVQSLFLDCAVLSPASIGAPAFVAAALHEDWDQRIAVAGRTLVLRRASASDPDVLVPLVAFDGGRAGALFPSEGDDLLCLASASAEDGTEEATPGGAVRTPRRRPLSAETTAAALLALADQRVRFFGTLVLALGLLSTLIFHFLAGLDLLDAVYFTVTTVAPTHRY